MKNLTCKWINVWLLSSLLLISPYAYSQNQSSQQTYPYSGGQAVFVQPPYGSSVYTEYRYSPHTQSTNRLPAYTTNQSVFVQQPYGVAPQTRVNAYPTAQQNSANRYSTPANFPSTTTAAYPFATVRSYTSSPYSTTVQYQTSNPNQPAPTYTNTETYPFTSTRQVVPVQTNQQVPGSYYNPSNSAPTTNSNYPTTTFQSPYPMTTAPEALTQPNIVNPPPPTNNQRY